MSGLYPSVSPSLQDRDLGDEYLVYDRRAGQIHVLNPTARRILELCDGQRDAKAIAALISDQYEIPYDEALTDVEELLGQLAEKGVVIYLGREERTA